MLPWIAVGLFGVWGLLSVILIEYDCLPFVEKLRNASGLLALFTVSVFVALCLQGH